MELKRKQKRKRTWKLFAGESMHETNTPILHQLPKEEGYEQISAIFLKTADNEKEHAKLHFRHFQE